MKTEGFAGQSLRHPALQNEGFTFSMGYLTAD
jgi:hypothetical protein